MKKMAFVILLITAALNTRLPAGTIAFYSFEEGSNGTGLLGTVPAQADWIIDSQGSNNGTPAVYQDKPSYIESLSSNLALGFGAKNNAIVFANSSVFQWSENSSKTLEFYIRRDGDGPDSSSAEFIMSKNYTSSGGWQVTFNRTTKTIRFQIQTHSMESVTAFNDLVWHHVAIRHTANSGTYELFVDYVKEAEITGFTSGSVTSAEFWVGRGYGWQNLRVFNGALDDIRISDQALSVEQFIHLEVAALWSFEEGVDGVGTTGQAPSDQGWILSNFNSQSTSATAHPGANGPTYKTSINSGLYLDFTGDTGDYITIPDSEFVDISEQQDITIEFYFKVINKNYASSPLNWLMCKGFTDSTNKGWGIYWNESDGKITFNIAGSTATSTIAVNDGYWYHFAITHIAQSGCYTLYIDHQQQTQIISYYDGSLNSDNLVVGRGWDWQYNRDFIGGIDQMRISSKSLSAQELMPIPVKMIDLATKANNLNNLVQSITAIGKLDPYANMRNKLVQKYMPYIDIMTQDGNTALAGYAKNDLERLIDEETTRLTAILGGNLIPTDSPRRIATQMPVFNENHIEQQVKWSDGSIETRPIFLFGFCAEQQDFRVDASFIGNDLRCNYAQFFTGPQYVMPSESMWNPADPASSSLDQDVVGAYKSAISDAYNNGIVTDMNISPHWIQSWFIANHPEYYADLGGFMKYTINQQEVKDIIGWSSRILIEQLSVQSGLWSCCILNEPCYFRWTSDPDTSYLWVTYLTDFYDNNILAANTNWNKSYSSWSNVTKYLYPPSTPFPSYPELYDWMKFNDTRIRDWALWLQDYIKAANSILYTHIKQNDRFYTQFNVMQGSDIDMLGKSTDLPGTDVGIYPWDKTSPINTDLYGISSTLPITTQRTVTGRSVINSEDHILKDNNTQEVEKGHVRAGIWLQAISGMDAMTAWIWGYDPDDELSTGLWKTRPGATEELSRTGMDLMRLMPQIVQFREKPVQIAVLYSRTSALRYPDYQSALSNTFDVLREMGLQVAVVTEQKIADGELITTVPSITAMILPGCKYLPEAVYDAVNVAAQANSLAVLGLGEDIAKYNEYCSQRSTIFEALDYTQLSDISLNALQTSLPQYLDNAGLCADITPTVNGTRTFGLYYNTATIDGFDYITAVNTTPEAKQVVWKDSEGKPMAIIDLLNLVPKPTLTANEYEPLEVVYGKLAKTGDANTDNVVDLSDFAIMAKNWHTESNSWQTGDFSGDGYIDIEDAILFFTNWCTE